MARRFLDASLLLATALCVAVVFGVTAQAAETKAYKLAATLKVGGEGGWDYATLDDKGERLFLPRTTHTIVVEAATGKIIGDIPKSSRTHGVALVPAAKRGFISDGKDGSILANLPIGAGVDATAFDNGTALASCADGTLWAIRETAPGQFTGVQTLKTAPGARTMAVDGRTGRIYLPTADMQPAAAGSRPTPIPGTFKVLVVERADH